MNYELAKQLKDAGFPLIDEVGYAYNENKKLTAFHIAWTGDFRDDWIYIPTLEELIEACGLGVSLSRYESGWTAKKWNHYDAVIAEVEWFDTPSEALAKLWLELKKL